MLMTEVEDIRGRLGVAYRALGCSLLSCRLFHSFTLHFFFHLCVLSFSHFAFVQKCSITNYRGRAALREQRNPFTLPAYKIRRSCIIDISRERERHAVAKKKRETYIHICNMYINMCVCIYIYGGRKTDSAYEKHD